VEKESTTIKKVIHFYGHILLLENSFVNNVWDLSEHYKQVDRIYGKIKGIGIKRYKYLRTALKPFINEIRIICDILYINMCFIVEFIGTCVIDESVIGYQSGPKAKKKIIEDGEIISVVWIQRNLILMD
jgi:hypothetical protein